MYLFKDLLIWNKFIYDRGKCSPNRNKLNLYIQRFNKYYSLNSTQIEILWNHDRVARQDVNKANCTHKNATCIAINDSYN